MSERRRHDLVQPRGIHAELAERAHASRPRERGHALGRCLRSPLCAERSRQLGDLLRRPSFHHAHEVRQHHGVRARMGRTGDVHDRLADRMMDCETGGAARVAGEHRTEGESVAIGLGAVDAARDQLAGP